MRGNTLLAVGKLRPAFREACDDYLARLRRYDGLVEREVRPGPSTRNLVERRRIEAERLRTALPAGALVVALDRLGTAWSSEALAARLARWHEAPRPVALLVGGADGLAPELLAAAEHRWSLGPLTLPHELARVVVLEQWYRAWTIVRREPYHK